MNANEHANDVSQDELPISAVERLVTYDEAKANGGRRTPEPPESDDTDNDDLACVDLLHRVWPDIAPSAAPNDNVPPRTLGDFRLLHELGRGGMGTVFEAEQISMGRHVALKVLPFAALVHENSLQRFRNEVRAAAALNHPHIVPVYSIGEERGVHFYAMQLIRGRTLADLIGELRRELRGNELVGLADSTHRTAGAEVEGSAATVREQALIRTAVDSRRDAESYRTAARLGIQAAEALQHAHDQGVLHRDIKPSNLMLDREGKLYVTDFGLARIEADAGMTMTGDILGTLRYMAPEQALAKRVVIDHRADIYSLGATLYELLTLQPAFGETDRSELLKRIALEEPRPLRTVDRCIPAELETIVLKAMAKDPDERYQAAQQLTADLYAFLEDRPILATPPSVWNRAAKWSRRHRAVVTITGIAAGVLILVLLVGSSITAVLLAREQDATSRVLKTSKQNEQIARAAIERMLTRVASQLDGLPDLTELQRSLLEDALQFYQQFLEQSENDPSLRQETARAHLRLGDIHRSLGSTERSIEAYKQATNLFEELVKEFPSSESYEEGLAEAIRSHGYGLIWTGKHKEHIELLERFLDRTKVKAQQTPTDPSLWELAAYAETDVGNAYLMGGMHSQAGSHFRAAVRILEDLYKNHPGMAKDREVLSHCQTWLGSYLRHRNELAEAEPILLSSLELRNELLKESPKTPGRKASVAMANSHLGGLRFLQGKYEEAERLQRDSIQTYEMLAREFPGALTYRKSLGHGYNALRKILWTMGRHAEFEEAARRALILQDGLAAASPDTVDYQTNAGSSHFIFGDHLQWLGRESEATDEYRRAQAIFESANTKFPDLSEPELCLATFFATCPKPQFQDSERAVKHARRAVQIREDPSHWEILGIALCLSKDWASAEEAFAKSFVTLSNAERVDGFFYRAIANVYSNKPDDARNWYQKGLEHCPSQPPLPPWIRKLRDETEAMIGAPKL